MRAMGSKGSVTCSKMGRNANRHRLLADGQMAGALDFAIDNTLCNLLLGQTNQEHHAQSVCKIARFGLADIKTLSEFSWIR